MMEEISPNGQMAREK